MAEDQEHAIEGDASVVRTFLARLGRETYYTYLLIDPDGVPFYAGKGKAFRVLEHQLEALRDSGIAKSNPFKCSKIRQIVRNGGTITYRIDRLFAATDELACLLREEALIAHYRRRSDGGTLTNLAAGLGSISGRDPFSAGRHAATLSGVDPSRPERTALNLFLRSLGGIDSVPIKPLSEYRSRLVPAYPSPKNLRVPSRRNGLTIAAAAIAMGLTLEPGVTIPRVFDYRPDPEDWPLAEAPPDVVRAVIENGAMSDVLKLGLAKLVPGRTPDQEALTIDAGQSKRIIALIGPAQAQEWALIANS